MASLKLLFDGHRWPTATVSEWRQPDLWLAGALDLTPVHTYAVITTTGLGRRWSTQKPLGFWRTFSEINVRSTEDIEMVVRRYGDPVGKLRPDMPTLTYYWQNLSGLLQVAAFAWEPVDENGISRLTDDKDRLPSSRSFLRDEAKKKIGLDFVQDETTGDLVPKAVDLGSFMIASAARMIGSQSPMMRCQECQHWFEFSHAAGRYCSAACRIAAHRKGN